MCKFFRKFKVSPSLNKHIHTYISGDNVFADKIAVKLVSQTFQHLMNVDYCDKLTDDGSLSEAISQMIKLHKSAYKTVNFLIKPALIAEILAYCIAFNGAIRIHILLVFFV